MQPQTGCPDPGPGAKGRDHRLTRGQRLSQSRLFRETYDQGRRWVGRFMVLWLRSGEGASLRLGVVASKKVGHAVRRAKAKRLLREAYRQNRYQFKGSFDVVLVARRDIQTASWNELTDELLTLASKAGLIPKHE